MKTFYRKQLAYLHVNFNWVKGNLTRFQTSLVGADVVGFTSRTRKKRVILKQLGQAKRQKSRSTALATQTQTSTKYIWVVHKLSVFNLLCPHHTLSINEQS